MAAATRRPRNQDQAALRVALASVSAAQRALAEPPVALEAQARAALREQPEGAEPGVRLELQARVEVQARVELQAQAGPQERVEAPPSICAPAWCRTRRRMR